MLYYYTIKPAQTKWVVPIVFAPKQDGFVRNCVDYRRLNAVGKHNLYLISRMDKCISSRGETAIFSALDENSRSWRVEIDKAGRSKTAFTSQHGLFQFLPMPFGLRSAPGAFQGTMDVILSSVRRHYVLVYSDDIIMFL